MGVLVIIVFLAAILGLIVVSNRLTQQRRAPIQEQIDSQRTQMQAFVAQSQRLDPKTVERVLEAQKSVEQKLTQASGLLQSAVKEQHYTRIQKILALVHTKLDNVQASMGRAQARADERAQSQAGREMEKQERAARGGSFGQRAAQNVPSRSSFGPPAQVTNQTTSWRAIPPSERGVCFFCSRPCLLRELTPVTVPIMGQAKRVLACPQDYATVQAGTLPNIRAFNVNGRPVPWYAYNRYNPYDNFYSSGYGTNFYMDMYPYNDFDMGYWNFDGPYAYDNDGNNQAYNFTPDAPEYQDYSAAAAAGEAMSEAGGVTAGGYGGGAGYQNDPADTNDASGFNDPNDPYAGSDHS